MPPSATAGRGQAKATLTREKVIERIRRWASLYGEPPGTADWNPSVARWRAQEWRVARYEAGDPETGERWPSTTAAKRRFEGSFDAAVRAAGLEPRPAGPRRPAGRVGLGAAEAAPAAGSREAMHARAREAEARAAAAERSLRQLEARLERAEAATAEARRRARLLGDRTRRAQASRDRLAAEAAAARAAGGDDARRAHADADVRVAAADERAGAAVRDAQRARGLAAAAVREHGRLGDALSAALRRAEDAEHRLRVAQEGGPGSPSPQGVPLDPGPAGRRCSRARCATWRPHGRRAIPRGSARRWPGSRGRP